MITPAAIDVGSSTIPGLGLVDTLAQCIGAADLARTRGAREAARNRVLPCAILLLLALFLLVSQSGRAQGRAGLTTAASGATIYQAKCGGCHSITANRIGPAHRGVYGRRAGMAPAYDYSRALKASKIVWTAAMLDRWLKDPQKLVKGSKMFLSVPDSNDRAAIIAFLMSGQAR
jgi:cytochrome c